MDNAWKNQCEEEKAKFWKLVESTREQMAKSKKLFERLATVPVPSAPDQEMVAGIKQAMEAAQKFEKEMRDAEAQTKSFMASQGAALATQSGPVSVEVFVEYTGQNGQRTVIPGGPFASKKAAHDALLDFADAQHGNYRSMIQLIDAYGFVVSGAGTVRVPIKP